MIKNFSEQDTLVSEWMRELRDVATQGNRELFRNNIYRIGQVAAYYISQHLPYTDALTQTPLATTCCRTLATQPVIATIMRAGLPLYNGILSYYNKADSAFIGAYRQHINETDFEIAQGYIACPDLSDRPLILADPMLATGASMIQTINSLLAFGQPSHIHIVAIIASQEGIDTVQQHLPNAHIWVGSIDNELDANKYIVPGLGDAGDLCFGEKLQH
jgi:uracil phosphoribosyltransferase